MFRASLDLLGFLLVPWQEKHWKAFLAEGVTRNPI